MGTFNGKLNAFGTYDASLVEIGTCDNEFDLKDFESFLLAGKPNRVQQSTTGWLTYQLGSLGTAACKLRS